MYAYVIINAERNFFGGFAQDGSAVWTTNKQSAELYAEMKFSVRDAAKIRSTDDENARVLQVRIDRNGYIR